jgi:hypothetical protein
MNVFYISNSDNYIYLKWMFRMPKVYGYVLKRLANYQCFWGWYIAFEIAGILSFAHRLVFCNTMFRELNLLPSSDGMVCSTYSVLYDTH